MYPPSRDWKWSVAVFDEPTLNAWCMPGGKMAIYTGIIHKLNLSDDEIGQIMGTKSPMPLLGPWPRAHVACHCHAGGMQLGSILVGRDLSILTPVAERGADPAQQPRQRIPRPTATASSLAARAGYDPHSAIRLWEKMSAASGNGLPQFLSTHPARPTASRC